MTRELILHITSKDFDETHIRGSGPGGQAKNKTSNGVRLKHRASGAVGEATDSRSQAENRASAFRRLRETDKWKTWWKMALAEAMGRPSIDDMVDDWMQERYVTTQVKDEQGRWVDATLDSLTD